MTDQTYVEDYQAILTTLDAYNAGAAKAESAIMSPSFAPEATVFSVSSDGALTGGAVKEHLFGPVDTDLPPSPDAQAAVVSVDIVGTAASARIDTDDLAGMRFTDFFHLLKIDGTWTIVGKAFHMHS
ncbi:MAG: nuclear transport factor 2 family protein [Pseudomonadota bacterium]